METIARQISSNKIDLETIDRQIFSNKIDSETFGQTVVVFVAEA